MDPEANGNLPDITIKKKFRNFCTQKTVSLNQRNISLIYGQRRNFFELEKLFC